MNLTRWIIVLVVIVVAGIDIVLALLWGKDATISVQITNWSHEYPFVAFLGGLLCGHFWTQNYRKGEK